MDIGYLFEQNDYVLISVFFILVLMSILTWVIIIIRWVKYYMAKRANTQFSKVFWHQDSLNEALLAVQNIDAPMKSLAVDAIRDRNKYDEKRFSYIHDNIPLNEYLTRHIRNSMNHILQPFSAGLTALASIGATAPFIGLFGTVWGIYHALINISHVGQVTIAAVSGPIGEALIATAAGLFVAIPAVLAYNALVRSNKNLSTAMDAFAHDLHVQLLNTNEDK